MWKWITAPLVCLLTGVPALNANPIALSTLNLVGTAQLQSPTVLRLTPNFDTNTVDPPAGAAWTPATLNVADPFSVSFSFQMWDAVPNAQHDPFDGSGGDGIAFVIQNDFRGTNAIGRGAGGMGFMGIFDSVAVMFDTYQNNPQYGDPNGNYIAVNTRGTDFNVPHHFCTDHQLTTDTNLDPDLPGVTCDSNPSLAMTGLLPRLDGEVHSALIVYNPGTLAVYVDSVPVLTAPLNLASTLLLQGGTSAYLGFTAGTRFSYQNQDILDFTYTPAPEPGTAWGCLAGLTLVALLGWKGRSQNSKNSRAEPPALR